MNYWKKRFPILHSVYHFEERKEQRIGHKTLGLSKAYSVFLVKENNQRYCQISSLSSSFTFLFRKESLLASPRVCVIIAEVLVKNPHRRHQKKLKKKEKKNSHVLESH
jgi:hypothetical protein